MVQFRSLKYLLVLAVLLRMLIMPFYFHPDIKTTFFQTSFLGQGVFDIYKYIDKNRENLPLKEDFTYFPLTYFVLGGYEILASPFLGGGFYSWINDASTQVVSETIGIHKYLFILKFLYLIFDVATAFLLTSFFKDIKQKKIAFTLWLFNPFTIILIYFYSNFDVIPVFLTLLSLYFARNEQGRDKIILSGILLGVAAGFKAYPIVFLPFLLLFSKNFKQGLLTLLATFATLFLIILPFISASFQKEALVSGLTTRLFFPGVSIGFGETLMAGVIALSALFFFGQLQREKRMFVWKYYVALLLLLFSFIHFHIQWLLWVAPFLILLITLDGRYKFIVTTLACIAFAIPLLYEDRSMSVGLLSAYSSTYNWLPLPFAVVQKVYDPYIVMSILHSGFIGGSLVLVWQMFREKTE